MSEPTRYTLTMESCEAGEVHYMHIKGKAESAPFGDYVLFEDYARLKAEVERLRASSFVTAVPVEQYERVVKAGDAMAERLNIGFTEVPWKYGQKWYAWHSKAEASVNGWLAAKEGKPSV